MGQEIQSREYKIMLDANRFEGSEDALRAQAARFWEVFGKAVAEVTDGSVRTKKKLKKIDADKRRKIRFYDTEDCFRPSISRCNCATSAKPCSNSSSGPRSQRRGASTASCNVIP